MFVQNFILLNAEHREAVKYANALAKETVTVAVTRASHFKSNGAMETPGWRSLFPLQQNFVFIRALCNRALKKTNLCVIKNKAATASEDQGKRRQMSPFNDGPS